MPESSESDDRVQAREEQGRQAKPSRSLKLNGPVRLESYDAEWPAPTPAPQPDPARP